MIQLSDPQWFWVLVPLGLLWVLARWNRARGRTLLGRARTVALACGFFFLALALARPQFGREVSQRIALKGNVILALDISRSMTAQDSLPTRLGAATAFASQVASDLEGLRVGLFLFAQEGFLYAPLTSDLRSVGDMLSTINPSLTTNQGTDFATTLTQLVDQLARLEREARDRGEDWAPTQVVVLSDGETHARVPSAVLGKYRSRHIPIHTALFGTERGGAITVPNQDDGATFLRFNTSGAKTVIAKADAKSLRTLSEETRGLFVVGQMGAASSLSSKIREAAQLGRLRSSFRVEREFFPECLLLALAAFALEMLLARWSVALRIASPAVVFLALFLASAPSAYAKEKKDEERTAVGLYNEGVGAWKRNDGKLAVELFQRAAQDATDPKLRKQALYNLGNSLLRMNDPTQALQAYQQARDTKSGSSSFDAKKNKDISDNIALAVKKEEQQKQQQQQQQKGQDKGEGESKPKDPKGPQNDYEAQRFSEEEKQRMYDLLKGEEQQIMQRSLEQRNKRNAPERSGKPW